MSTTAGVVNKDAWFLAYRMRGYFFRVAAMLTIFLGVAMHLCRVVYGDALTLQHVVTVTAAGSC